MPLDQQQHSNTQKHGKQPAESEPEDLALTSCGFGSWRPKWLQPFANPLAFLVNICFVGICQGMAGSLIYSNVNTLEKRYRFDSKISALIFTADNFSGLVLSPIVGYYGVRFNRSRLISFGEIILGLSCIATALPYYIYGADTHMPAHSSDDTTVSISSGSTTNFEMCDASGGNLDCSLANQRNTIWPAVIILFLANFFRGIGFTTYYIIAMPYMDDNVSKKSSPIYISIMQCVMLIGPAIGFYFSAFCLQFWEDPWNDPGIARTSPHFVGAWHIGFLVTGILLLFAAVPMLLFPPQFKGASVKADVIKKEMKESGGTVEAMLRFIRNPMIVIYFLGNLFRYFGVGGFYMLMTKYIESQYRVSSSNASGLLGTASVTPISIGILTGGLFIGFYRPKTRFLFTFVFLAELVSFFTIGSGIFLGCNPIKMGGAQMTSDGFSLNATCNSNCDCTTRVFTPICGPDATTTYFSPCHAGCTAYNALNSTFEQCSCFNGPATKGYCPADSNCDKLNIYLGMLMLGTFISSTAKTGNSLITFRTVAPMDKGVTNGIIGTLLSILAFIPFPIIFGHIADSACLIWETKCNRRGNCWWYDSTKFRDVFHGVAITFMGIGSFFDFLLIFYADRIKNLYDDEVVEVDNTKEVNGQKVGEEVELQGADNEGKVIANA